MKTKLAAVATVVALAVAAPVAAMEKSSMDQGFNMLTGALYNSLRSEGFETDNIHKLTLNEVVEIRTLLSGDMSNNRTQIKHILDTAGDG